MSSGGWSVTWRRRAVGRSAEASLLVVGAWGLGGGREPLLGSVSQRCLHHAPCQVAESATTASQDRRTTWNGSSSGSTVPKPPAVPSLGDQGGRLEGWITRRDITGGVSVVDVDRNGLDGDKFLPPARVPVLSGSTVTSASSCWPPTGRSPRRRPGEHAGGLPGQLRPRRGWTSSSDRTRAPTSRLGRAGSLQDRLVRPRRDATRRDGWNVVATGRLEE